MRIKEGGRLVPNEKVFQQNILEYLDQDKELWKPQLKGTGTNGEYPGASPQVYMFTPKSRTGADRPQYTDEVNRITEKAKAALDLGAGREPKIFNYQKPGTNAVSVLFMYDYDPNYNDSKDPCKQEAAWNAWWGGRFTGPVFFWSVERLSEGRGTRLSALQPMVLFLVKLLVLCWKNRRSHFLNCLSFSVVNYVVLWNSSSYQYFKIDNSWLPIVGLGLTRLLSVATLVR